jgi:hypothetical protein
LGKIYCEAFIGSQEPGLLDVIAMDLFFPPAHSGRSELSDGFFKAVTLFQEEASGSFIGGLGGELKEVEIYPRQTLISLETPSNGNRRHSSVSIYSDPPRELRSSRALARRFEPPVRSLLRLRTPLLPAISDHLVVHSGLMQRPLARVHFWLASAMRGFGSE